MPEYWFKGMRVEALEIGVEADSQEEAQALLDLMYGEDPDPRVTAKLKFVTTLEGSGIVVGESIEVPDHEETTVSLGRLAEILACSEAAALEWLVDNQLPVNKWGDPDTDAEERLSLAEAQETAPRLLYIPLRESVLLSRLPQRAILVMYADEVGRHSLVTYLPNTPDAVRRPMGEILNDLSLNWPLGITIRQHEGQAQVVTNGGGRVLLTTF